MWTTWIFLISNFCRVQYVVCFLLGNSPASEFYMPTFRNTLTYLPMKIEQTECSATSAYKIQTPGNYPEENILHEYCLWQLSHSRVERLFAFPCLSVSMRLPLGGISWFCWTLDVFTKNLMRKSIFFYRTKISGALHEGLEYVLYFWQRHAYHNNTENSNTKERALFLYHGNSFDIYVTVQTLLRHNIGNNYKYRSLWGTNFVFIKCVSIHVTNAE
jgi:hypothetical protein